MSADDSDGGVTAWVDPWETMASWRSGQCDVGALAVVLADELPCVEVVDDELSSDVSFFDGWWHEIGDGLADFGFEAADFDALFATLVPRLDRRFLRSAPTDGGARLNSSESPLPWRVCISTWTAPTARFARSAIRPTSSSRSAARRFTSAEPPRLVGRGRCAHSVSARPRCRAS